MTFIDYANMRFTPDFARAIAPSGEEVRFSRRERALLVFFSQHPHQVIRRERLLGAIEPQDMGLLDRNIDYIVSRLRRKLRDSTRQPTFIATQYGEGYRWVATPGTTASGRDHTPESPPLLVIGPVRGLDHLNDQASIRENLDTIHRGLKSRFKGADEIRVAMECDTDRFLQCRFSLEISVLKTARRVRASSILRDGRTGYIHGAWQGSSDVIGSRNALSQVLDDYVDEVHQRVLTASMVPPPATLSTSQVPLEVALDQAARLFSAGADKHEQVTGFLRSKLAADPHDHRAGILLASNLHVAMVRQNPSTLSSDSFQRSLLEIESLVVEHLGGAQDEPLFLSAAAKLLYIVGHRKLALELAEAALDQDVSYAAVLMTYAQIQMFEGDLQCALDYYDFALERSEDDQFRSLILVLKATALRAQGTMAPLPGIVEEVVSRDENMRLLLHASLLGDQPECDAAVLQLAPLLPAEEWRQQLRLNYYVNARLFRRRDHRQQLLRGILQLAIQHAGNHVLFAELQSDLPQLCTELTQRAATAS